MRRLDGRSRTSLVQSWIGWNFTSIIQEVEGALRASGFSARTTVDQTGNIRTYISSDGELRGILNISQALLAIATSDKRFDNKLDNPIYEIIKIKHNIRSRVEAAKALFAGDMAQLCELSKSGVKFRIVEKQ